MTARRRCFLNGRARGERGASMVEFALILPLLILFVFGIIEFGATFNNYQALRQGVREAARQGAVGNFGPAYNAPPTSTNCHLDLAGGSPTDNVKNLMCLTKSQVGLDASKVKVKVLSGGSDFTSAGTFSKSANDSLIVCAQYRLTPMTSLFSPFLGGKYLRTKAAIRIEKDDITATGGEENPPSGSDWNWCTVSSSSP